MTELAGTELGARHQRVQRLRRLLKRSSARQNDRAFVAEGVKVVAAALAAGTPIESLYVAAEGRSAPAVKDLSTRAFQAGARIFTLGPGLMDRVADTVTPQPVCAIVPMAGVSLQEVFAPPISDGPARTVFVCTDVRDPGNLGAVLRSAAAAGAAGIVCCDGCADVYNPKAVRASAGAIFQVPIVRGGQPASVVGAARDAGFSVVGTSPHEGVSYLEADLGGDLAIVLGNEASGLDDDVRDRLDLLLTIPMHSGSESLNVAMTATILGFDVARRRSAAHAEQSRKSRPVA